MSERTSAVINEAAAWIAGLRYEDIPSDVIHTSKLLMLDGLGVSMAATTDPVGKAALTWAAMFGSSGASLVIGSPDRLSRADAALVNGTICHAIDFDDHGFGGHATACVMPAVLAFLDGHGFDGRRVLTAYVAGMEIFGRLAISMPIANIHEYGFHPTAVLGIVSAAAAAAKAADATESQIAEALALSTVGGAGVTANFGTPAKPLHAGTAAATGVRAFEFAASGFTGNRRVLEDPEGFGEAYVRGLVDWPKFRTALDGPFRLQVKQPSIKQYPCCGGNQRSIQNLSRIMTENNLVFGDIERIDVHISPRQLTSLRYAWAENSYEAKFCLPFNVAATLAHGAPTLASYRDEQWNDPGVLAARDVITFIPDVEGEDKHNIIMDVFAKDGRHFSKPKPVVHGSAEDPMTTEEVSAKYFACCDHSEIDRSRSQRIHDALLNIENDVDEFVSALGDLTRMPDAKGR